MRHLRAPFVSYAIIGASVLSYIIVSFLVPGSVEIAVAAGFGVIPSVLFSTAQLPAELAQAPAWATPVTHVFLHAGFIHLASNMLFLWVFGDNVEDQTGHGRFAILYFLCGFAGSLAHALMNAQSQQPLIGASGAIAGIIAAYLLLYPRVRIWGLVFKVLPLNVPAYWVIAAWFVLQVFQAILAPAGGVGWWAHIGGFVAGLALTPLLVRRGTVLFGR
jgi:membrane associated rhomboid family serine protease